MQKEKVNGMKQLEKLLRTWEVTKDSRSKSRTYSSGDLKQARISLTDVIENSS